MLILNIFIKIFIKGWMIQDFCFIISLIFNLKNILLPIYATLLNFLIQNFEIFGNLYLQFLVLFFNDFTLL